MDRKNLVFTDVERNFTVFDPVCVDWTQKNQKFIFYKSATHKYQKDIFLKPGTQKYQIRNQFPTQKYRIDPPVYKKFEWHPWEYMELDF